MTRKRARERVAGATARRAQLGRPVISLMESKGLTASRVESTAGTTRAAAFEPLTTGNAVIARFPETRPFLVPSNN